MARSAGLEPATLGLEGRCSIQLSYERKGGKLVGAEGFEPPTLWSQTRCATRLRYAPSTNFYRICRLLCHCGVRIILRQADFVKYYLSFLGDFGASRTVRLLKQKIYFCY